MSTVKYTAGSLMLWACFSARCSEHLVIMHGIMDSIKYQQIKNQNLTASVRSLIMCHVWIFHQDNNPKQTSKSTQKWVTEYKMNLLPWLSQFSDLNPTENEWGELKRRNTVMELWIWRIWRDSVWRKWSLISCQVFSKLFRHYGRKLRAVTLGKGWLANNCGQHELENFTMRFPRTFNCFTSMICWNFVIFFFNER